MVDGRPVRFFFMMGCYKSGTNWVQNLVNLHPRVDLRGEFHFEVLLDAFAQISRVHWFRGAAPKFQDAWQDSAEAAIRTIMAEAARQKPEAEWIGDRSPGGLRTVIRGAPHITITRDCRDVLVSWSFHHMRLTDERGINAAFREVWRNGAERFRADPENFNPMDGLLGHEPYVRARVQEWTDITRSIRTHAQPMRDGGTPVLELRYEDLHADLASQRRRLFAHLGLNEAEAQAPSVESKTAPGFAQEDRTSKFRKGKVGDWRTHLKDWHIAIIKEIAGDELIAQGYEQNMNW